MDTDGTIVYLAGSPWDGIVGTDRQLATQLGLRHRVLWVDPPESAMAFLRARRSGKTLARLGVSSVAPGVKRLRCLSPPGVSRPLIRSIAGAWVRLRVRHEIAGSSSPSIATVLATPEGRFPRIPGSRIYFVTDDWRSGADLMGMDSRRVERVQLLNLRDADVVCAVSDGLLTKLTEVAPAGLEFALLPNGCVTADGRQSARPAGMPDSPFAVMVGQLNERIDPDMIAATADIGVPVVVIGPRTERSPDTSAAFDRLFQHPGVQWVGPVPQASLAPYLSAASIGLTPYADTAFNRASFPLKTLEYLAAGLPAVSTDLPAVHWLDTPWIEVAATPADFARKTRAAIDRADDADGARLRQAFAAQHSWSARADQLLAHVRSGA